MPWVIKVIGRYRLPFHLNLSGFYSGIAGNL
jgi:hypothetical protein